MRPAIIDCPGCGAPLGGAVRHVRPGALVPCLYCGALLRFPEAGDLAPTVERRITPELLARAREAALRGGRAEAVELCVREGRVERGSAEAAVDDMIKNVASRTVFSQTLSPLGWALVLGSGALVLGGVAVLAIPSPARLAGLAFLAFGGLNLAVLARGVVTSLRFLVASRGVARIVRSVCVAPTGFSDGSLIYSLAIDVVPDGGGAPFHARLVIPVRPGNVGKVAEGRRLGVRFADGGAWLRSDGDRVVPQADG